MSSVAFSTTVRPSFVSASQVGGWVFLACAALTTGCGPSQKSGAAPKSEEHALLGAPAPDFDLPRIGSADGASRVSLSDSRGNVTVVDFWATWCAPCRQSFPAYEQLVKGRPDVAFVAVSVDDDPSAIPAFIEETRVTFPVAWDEGQGVSQRYAPPTMPTSYVIDKNGIVRFVHTGFRAGDEAELATVIDGLR
jgi:thiol-disulfide isomerase/thioredoxin